METGKEQQCELHSLPMHEGADGFWTLVRARYLAKNGERYILYLSVENITERIELNKARLALAEKNLQTEALIKNAPGGVEVFRIVDNKPVREYVSDGVARLYGVKPEEMQTLFDLDVFSRMHPDDQPRVKAAVATVIAHHMPFSEQYRTRRADGSYIWVNLTGNPAIAPDGILRFYCVYTDVTERAEAAEKLRVEREKTNYALIGSKLMVWEYDPINHINRRLGDYSNANLPEIIENFPESTIARGFIAEGSIDDYRELHDAVAAGEKTISRNILLRVEGDEDYRWRRITYQTVFENGKPVSAIGTATDVTESVENERMYADTLAGLVGGETGAAFTTLLADLTDDRVEAVSGTFAYAGMSYTAALEGLCTRIYDEKQRDEVAEALSRDVLMAAFLAGRPTVSAEYQRYLQDSAIPRWLRTTVKTFREAGTGKIKLIQNTVDIDREVTDRDIAAILTGNNFEMVSLIYVDAGYMRCYQHSPLEERIDLGVDCPYADGLRQYLDLFMRPELREQALDALSIESMMRSLQTDKIGSAVFPLEVDGTTQYKRWRFCWRNAEQREIIMSRADVTDIWTLQRHSDEMRQALSTTNTVICHYDVATRTLTMPETYATLYEIPTVVKDIPYSAHAVAPGDREAFIRFYERIMEGEKSGEAVIQFIRADGNTG